MKTTIKILGMAALLFISGAAYAQFGLIDAVKDAKKDKEAKKQQEQRAAKEAEQAKTEAETKVKINELNEKGKAAKKAYNYNEAIANFEECAKLNETVEKKDFKTLEFSWAIDELKRRADVLAKMNTAYDAKQWNEFLKLATDSQYGFGTSDYHQNKIVCVWRDDIPADIKAKIKIAQEEAQWICAQYDPNPTSTNDFHANNIGKILFSKKEMKSEDNHPALADNFTLKDDIYGHIYLKNSFRNECYSIGWCTPPTPDWNSHLRITVDGSASDIDSRAFNPTSDKSEFGFLLATDVQSKRSFEGNYGTESAQCQWLWEFFYYLPAGTHKIKLEKIFEIPEGGKGSDPKYQEKFGKESVLASGEFILTINTADKLAFSNKMCIPFDKVGINDAVIEARFKREAGPGALRSWITSKDWNYERNVYGVVIKRSIYGQVILKDAKTGKYVLENIGLDQEAVGNGFSNGTCSVEFPNNIPAEWVK